MKKEENIEVYCKELSEKSTNTHKVVNKVIKPSFLGQLIHTSVLEKELNITSNTRRDWVLNGILPKPIKLNTQIYFINDELTELLIHKKRGYDTI
jgi:hypothetical protein